MACRRRFLYIFPTASIVVWGFVACFGWGAASEPAAAQSHRLRFDRLSRPEGLSQVSVTSIAQDPQGFMWIGTADGLNRYDGYRFKVYKHDPGDPHSLSQNIINGLYVDREGMLWILTLQAGVLNRFDPAVEGFERHLHEPDDPHTLLPAVINPAAIHEDHDGRLWLGTFGGGINLLDKTTGRVERLVPDPEDEESLSGAVVSALLQDRSGVLWIGTLDGGLNQRLPPDGSGRERFRRFTHDPDDPGSLSANGVTWLWEDGAGELWVGTNGGGLNRYDRERGTFQRLRHHPGDPYSLASDTLPNAVPQALSAPVHEDRSGALWIVTANGLSRLHPDRSRFTNYSHDSDDPQSLSHDGVNAVHQDRSGTVWVTTQDGLNSWDPERENFTVCRSDAGDPQSLSGNLVNLIYEGRSGILWFGTFNAGLSKFSPMKHKFKHYTQNPSNPQGLADNMVFALFEDSRGRLWVGTLGAGLHRFDAKRERVTARFFLDPGSPRDLGSNFVRDFLQDSRGRLWAGTVGGGLVRLDDRGERVLRRYLNDPADPRSLSNNVVFDLFEDSGGDLWIGTGGGWNRFDPETELFDVYRNDPDDPSSLPFNIVRVTYEDRSGTLWVGTQQGLARFDREAGTFFNYRHDFRSAAGLSSDNILDLYQDEAGYLWVGTYGGGLNRLHPESGEIVHYTTRDGLPNDSVYSVLPDDDGYFWLSTNEGLSRFDPRTEGFENYGVDDGLQGIEFNGRSFFRSPSGEMFFGGVNGFNAFYPGEIHPSDYMPPVVLTALRKYGREAKLKRALWALDEVRLSHRDRFISFEFVALDYSHPERNQYAYRMEGFDREWIYSGSRHQADYTNLPGGHYTFRVKAANSDGVWNEEGASVGVVIVPPPWKTWWAYTLYTLAAFGMVAGYVRYKTANHRAELERQKVEAENRRKTEELEQARALQLSLVPDMPPTVPGLEISAFMKTATEVGGDFYDFITQPDGSLWVATGDATGHGLSAGMMVAMTKAALGALELDRPEAVLTRLNRILRAVHPERMSMAFGLTHIADGRAVLSSAGMPPAYCYRAATGEVEEALVEGLPLGSMEDTTYQATSLDLEPGDALLLLSDGLPELTDERGQSLGYEAIPRRLTASGAQGSGQIVGSLLGLCEEWSKDLPLDDDVTLLVIKRTAA